MALTLLLRHYKVGHYLVKARQVLQREATLLQRRTSLLQRGLSIAKRGKHFYKVEEIHVITKWGKSYCKVWQVIYYNVGQLHYNVGQVLQGGQYELVTLGEMGTHISWKGHLQFEEGVA